MSNSHQVFGSQAWLRQCIASVRRIGGLRPRFWIGLFVCACGLALPACRGSQGPPDSNNSPPDTRKATFTTPPFSTKEPERYQATRITSFARTGSTENSSSWQTNQVSIARDGERRREEYSAGASERIIYLEIPAGRFIVMPNNSVYADLNTASRDTEQGNHPYDSADDFPGLSPDQLLNEPHAPATYEKLGTEMLAGRVTTKYRVVVPNRADSQDETLIWIDEVLGMPVRSEARSSAHSSTVTMELKDVRLDVDESLFSWPSDYRKIDARQVFDLIRKEGKPATYKQDKK